MKKLESIVAWSGRRAADLTYFFGKRVVQTTVAAAYLKDPKVAAAVSLGSTVISKTAQVVAKNYKRKDLNPVELFNDAIDASTDAF